MAEAQVYPIRDRRWTRGLLSLVKSRRRRAVLALLFGCAAGPLYAYLADTYMERFTGQPVLEYDPGTVYISRYLGQPLADDEYWEADPAKAPTEPNLDRFYRTVASRVKAIVQTNCYSAYVQGIGACDGDLGWPFVSTVASYRVTVDEYDSPNGPYRACHVFRAAEDGTSPDRPWAWWANAVAGSLISVPIFLGLVSLLARLLVWRQHPVAGFPVIVQESSPLHL